MRQPSAHGDLCTFVSHDGASSVQGPLPFSGDNDRFFESRYDAALLMLGRRVLEAAGCTIESDRVRAHQSPAFAQASPVPLIESWVVAERVDIDATDERWIEFWHATVDRTTRPPNPYRTPLVAAAYSRGAIVAMAAIELMPETHDDAYLIEFDGARRSNLGAVPTMPDPAAFRQMAFDLLFPRLFSR